MLRATRVMPASDASISDCEQTVTLDYDARFKRRIAMTSDQGLAFVLDLDTATELHDGDYLALDDGQQIRVRAAPEPLLEVTADSGLQLMRIIWHIGNRHLPCALSQDAVLLRRDHVIAAMIKGLGGQTRELQAPFCPESGAYGRGRLHSHEH